MAWSINYSTSGTTISFNICADVGGGYFYILQPDGKPTPGTYGGKKVAASSCITFSEPSSDLTQTGTYTMVLADLTAQEKTQAQVWFYVTPSPFAVTPSSGSSTGGGGGGGTAGYNCVSGACQYVSSNAQYATLSACQASCTSGGGGGGGGGGTTCPGQVNLFGTCLNKTYLIAGVGGFVLLMILMRRG